MVDSSCRLKGGRPSLAAHLRLLEDEERGEVGAFLQRREDGGGAFARGDDAEGVVLAEGLDDVDEQLGRAQAGRAVLLCTSLERLHRGLRVPEAGQVDGLVARAGAQRVLGGSPRGEVVLRRVLRKVMHDQKGVCSEGG